MDEVVSGSKFRRWSDVLWPLGGTVIGLLVVPLAIDQYPEFFHENRWLLPLSVCFVVTCPHSSRTASSDTFCIRVCG
jgi:hypothetical protein